MRARPRACPMPGCYEGRAVVIDPDIFAVADIWDLLSRDMHGKAIMCRMRSGPKGLVDKCIRQQRDAARLRQAHALGRARAVRGDVRFTQRLQPWVCAQGTKTRDTIDLFEAEWNDFDRPTADQDAAHHRRKTQPWKTGLPVDFTPAAQPPRRRRPGLSRRGRRWRPTGTPTRTRPIRTPSRSDSSSGCCASACSGA